MEGKNKILLDDSMEELLTLKSMCTMLCDASQDFNTTTTELGFYAMEMYKKTETVIAKLEIIKDNR